MSRFDLLRIATEVRADCPDYTDVVVHVDTVHHPPTVIELRCKHGRIKVWQSGNTHPRLEVSSLMPRYYPLLQSVMARLDPK